MILERLSKLTGLSSDYLITFSKTASHRYKTYKIPKRNGGLRLIEHPSKELKSLQRILVRELFYDLPLHKAAMAYRKGIGIKHNASEHVNNSYLLRIDFHNFFPSISSECIGKFLKTKFPEVPFDEIKFVCEIVCRNGRLTIGAPSSPFISNAILYDFDKLIARQTQPLGVSYTRYADDLTFSSNEKDVLGKIRQIVITSLHEIGLPLTINDKKSVFTSKKRLRAVTGIVLTSENKMSVGRGRKRKLRSKVFRLMKGQMSEKEIESLKGEISYIMSIEPDILYKLNNKFGPELIKKLK